MTDYQRPSNLPAWAESGDKVQPDDAVIQIEAGPRAQFFGRAESFWSEHGYEPMQVSIFAEWGA